MACEPPPGRKFIIGPRHSFGDLVEAIDAAFARWDLAHLHGFELADGRRIGLPDPGFPTEWLDEGTLTVTKELKPGDAFEYIFDFGDDWRHSCTIEAGKSIRSTSTARRLRARFRSGDGGRSPTNTAAEFEE
jgi:Plasmid pRiA4b ORF-3-like protein